MPGGCTPATSSSITAPARAFTQQAVTCGLPPLLDKIKSNAVNFVNPGGEIRFELAESAGHATLDILNEGPPIPREVLDSLLIGMMSRLFG